jgi:phosphopantothenoylcysteine decarboxylase/phosphopantothenate--cysteine ligase
MCYLLGGRAYDVVIHLAAVGDYSVESIEVGGSPSVPAGTGKIASGGDMTLKLRPNFKIIERLKGYSRNPGLVVVGFKLTNTDSSAEREAKIRKLAGTPGVDFVVHNDLTELRNGIFNYTLYRDGAVSARLDSQKGLAEALSAGLGEA